MNDKIILPIFPLNGVILFPNTNLPLNIFEDRYLKMIDFSLSSNKKIHGIILSGGPMSVSNFSSPTVENQLFNFKVVKTIVNGNIVYDNGIILNKCSGKELRFNN